MLFFIISNHIISYISYLGMNYSNMIGFMLFFIFMLQFMSGILLSNYYLNLFLFAYNSIVYLMIEINNGWLMSIYHILFAFLLIFFIFIHYIRGIWIKLKNLMLNIINSLMMIIWLSGFLLSILILVNAVIGYILVCGQMSYWGLQVMLNLIAIIPFIGLLLSNLIWCNSKVMLNRIFSIHWLMGFFVVINLLIHIIMLHNYSSCNMLFNSNSSLLMPFFPYLFKDYYSFLLLLLFIMLFYFMEPDYIGNSDNNIIANPLITPLNMMPESYLLIVFFIIRSIMSKTMGVIVVFIIFFSLLFLFIIM